MHPKSNTYQELSNQNKRWNGSKINKASSIDRASLTSISGRAKGHRSAQKNPKVHEFNWEQKHLDTKKTKILNLSISNGKDRFEMMQSLEKKIEPEFRLNSLKNKEINEKLYFLNETREKLPKDFVELTKLNLVKNQTIKNYLKETKELQNKINFQLDDSMVGSTHKLNYELEQTKEYLQNEQNKEYDLDNQILRIGGCFILSFKGINRRKLQE